MRRTRVPKVDIEAQAPDFELPDFTGSPFRLSAQKGATNILLVFNRGFM